MLDAFANGGPISLTGSDGSAADAKALPQTGDSPASVALAAVAGVAVLVAAGLRRHSE